MKGLEPSRITPYGPKPYAATSYATSTRWSKCDIPHEDITVTYPLSLLCMEINSNRHTWIRTKDKALEEPCDSPLHYMPIRDLTVCALLRGM